MPKYLEIGQSVARESSELTGLVRDGVALAYGAPKTAMSVDRALSPPLNDMQSGMTGFLYTIGIRTETPHGLTSGPIGYQGSHFSLYRRPDISFDRISAMETKDEGHWPGDFDRGALREFMKKYPGPAWLEGSKGEVRLPDPLEGPRGMTSHLLTARERTELAQGHVWPLAHMDGVTPQVLHLTRTGGSVSLYATRDSSLLDSINRGVVGTQFRNIELSLPVNLPSIGEAVSVSIPGSRLRQLARNANITDVVISSLSHPRDLA